METIKVNMNPNPLDVQTIHASQNDSEAREWGFELHNNGDVIDSSEISDQLVFKAYKGGTEQILPENGSVPTTSPFLGDIKYPQGLLTDQEFLYRQSPTEEDGLAKITDIKGNTIVWNQLYQNTNIPTSQTKNGVTITNNNDGSWTLNGTASANTYFYHGNGDIQPIVGHKYLMKDCVPNGVNQFILQFGGVLATVNSNNSIVTATSTSLTNNTSYQIKSGETVNVTFRPQIFDLTKMGLDSITSVEEFTSLFPLPFYDFNQGSLLSFNGTGIKTVGFNQWDEEWEVGAYNSADGSKADNVRDRIRNKNPIRIFPSVNYYKNKGMQVYYYDASMNFIGWNSIANQGILTPPSNACYMNFNGLANTGTTYNHDICINISSSRNGQYEPYASSTLSLPILTYFPNGMDGVGTDYDELTNTKASTRMARVDLGSLNWQLERANYNVFLAGVQSYIKPPVDNNTVANIKCALYSSDTNNNVYGYNVDKAISVSSGGALRIRDTSFSDANTFKQSLSGVYLVYPLATPTETEFATASLVTENAEIPLSNNDGVLIGKCTEELSAEPGFHDAKIKLSDADGECYSNKLQLHVERSPQ